MLINLVWGHFFRLGIGDSKNVTKAEAILSKMTLDKKISQMVPAERSGWYTNINNHFVVNSRCSTITATV